MTHAMLTVAIPFPKQRAGAVQALLDRMGNPPGDAFQRKLDALGMVHFMSGVVVREPDRPRAQLVLEISADGDPKDAMRQIAQDLRDELGELLDAAGEPHRGRSLADILLRSNLRLGPGRPSTAGIAFDGSPAMTVRRIKDEARLAERIGGELREVLETDDTPLEKLRRVRKRLWEEGPDGEGRNWKWAFAAEPAPFLEGGKERTLARKAAVFALAAGGLLWPLLLVPLVLWPFVGFGPALLVSFALLVLAGLAAAFRLRRLEKSDKPDDAAPQEKRMAAILEQEDRGAQNLLFAVSAMKPGPLRRLALRFAFGAVRFAALRIYRPGFLRTMGVIHFARWALLPGTDRLLFFSNFSNGWESYLEDFIVKTPSGITSIWSNAEGFPRTRWLFGDGVTDRSRFLRWARLQQEPVPFWYRAYPDLAMGRIRNNAAIRRGVAEARTDAEAADWLACFGGAPRPASAIDKPEVPTLVFGGLSKLPHAHCLVLSLPEDSPEKARAWLGKVRPGVTFGEAADRSAMVLGLSAEGLRRLGVAGDDLATFPIAFQHGMADPGRARVLGDTGSHAVKEWHWGKPGTADVFVALYDGDDGAFDEKVERFEAEAVKGGLTVRHSRRLEPLPQGQKGGRPEPVREPFGFADGVSQPLLPDTPKARRSSEADHVVKAGELVLGYPDNTDRPPPMPSVAADRDPKGLLPDCAVDSVAGLFGYLRGGPEGRRELGRDGTFLVVRHMDQYPLELDNYVLRQADALLKSGRSPWALPRDRLAALLKAKMVGRWPDGRSLVRHPEARCGDGRRPKPDNAFRFAHEDPQGLQCPFGSHVRRSNPRDAFDGDSPDPVAVSNRHRILRVGRAYKPAKGEEHPGLMFMCLNADIERQFEFVHRNWVFGRNFHPSSEEVDPLLGHAADDGPRNGVFTIPTRQGPVQLRGMPDFVRVKGGGYFFLPGRRALRYLAEGIPEQRAAAVAARDLVPAE